LLNVRFQLNTGNTAELSAPARVVVECTGGESAADVVVVGVPTEGMAPKVDRTAVEIWVP